jgi:DNA-binding GntR family transcriptional regulator
MTRAVEVVARDNLTARVYHQLRSALMEGRFWPGHRLKIRELAAAMGVSETPVREAVMQLVCEKGLEMQAARSITVAELTLAQYLELREIRLYLEGLAAEAATSTISDRSIKALARTHDDLSEAEKTGRWVDAVHANWRFHHTLYQSARRPELLAMIEGIWLRNGPLVNYLYPHARPTYAGRHQHLAVIEALQSRDPSAVRNAIQSDMIEGGTLLVKLLEQIEKGEVSKEDLRKAASTNQSVSPQPAERVSLTHSSRAARAGLRN